ncbi:hypothetical protein BUALT_Bualt04G0023600 [Buddleja alternifolia]|uniref:DUF4283 domain-containing protein n=1 Tax=Buddleja alternifolia TaxID=168488 RepID=A0AAV6XWX4_9LAMI|nr:hypothetical protein BUALT_Bualt04G0023600 [Buddleja alternifolia]
MKKGLRGLYYSRNEMDEMVAPLKFALVGKFSSGTPSIARIRARFAFWSSKDFSPSAESLVVPVWVSLLNLPVAFFHRKSIHNIACLLGSPLKIDEPTTDYTRPSFARVCVEVNHLDPLVNDIWLGDDDGDITQKVMYKNLPLYCPTCSHYGHVERNCLLKAPKNKNTPDVDSTSQEDLRIILDKKKSKLVEQPS